MGPNEAKQMEMLLEEGGIADDGTTVDPVSGNEVPPGSMAKEVRDDVPAQLSEGEYVVPADVVRFFGVKFFEDLRSEAKGGLSAMEANGRIGGEPVSQTMDNQADGELTPEELSVLQELGMAVGGMVPQATNNMYQQPSPIAVGNTGSYNSGDKVLYAADGVDVSASNVDPYTAQFTSGMGSSFAPGFLIDNTLSPQEEPTEVVTLYGPNGEVEAVILPSQKARYDELIEAGYKTDQVEVTTETTVGEEPDGGGLNDGNTPSNSPTGTGTGLGISVSQDTRDAVSDAVTNGLMGITGPLGFVADTLTGKEISKTVDDIVDNIIDGIFGPVSDETDEDTTPTPTSIDRGDVSTTDAPTGGSPATSSAPSSAQVAAEEAMGLDPFGGEGPSVGGNAVGIDGPAPGANADGNAPGVSAAPGAGANAPSAGAANSAAAGSGHEGNADPDAGGSMLNTGGLVQRRSKKKKKK